MDSTWKNIVWQQFGASIDMLGNALDACPDWLWNDRSRQPEYWYLVFHTLFWLDLYLTDPREDFAPPPPFTLDELDPEGVLPKEPYTKTELQIYLKYGRDKCRSVIDKLTEEEARQHCRFHSFECTFQELFLYNMRHVQHHAGQLNLILRKEINWAPRWVTRANGSLEP